MIMPSFQVDYILFERLGDIPRRGRLDAESRDTTYDRN
jgi:hypothetical protein